MRTSECVADHQRGVESCSINVVADRRGVLVMVAGDVGAVDPAGRVVDATDEGVEV